MYSVNAEELSTRDLYFKCRGLHVEELFRRFGHPDGAVVKDARCRTMHAAITSKTLFWLSQMPDFGIRLKWLQPLLEVVNGYYNKVAWIPTDLVRKPQKL